MNKRKYRVIWSFQNCLSEANKLCLISFEELEKAVDFLKSMREKIAGLDYVKQVISIDIFGGFVALFPDNCISQYEIETV